MSTHVAGLLTEVASINDVGEQMRLATNARRVLVEWPQESLRLQGGRGAADARRAR